MAGQVTALCKSLKVFTTDSKWEMNFFLYPLCQCGFIVLLDPRDQTECAGPASVTPVWQI